MATQVYEHSMSSTQAGGAVQEIITPAGHSAVGLHSVQVAVTSTATGLPAVAAAGTLSVQARIPGSTVFQELGVVTLSAPDPVVFDGFYTEIRAVSTGFDADKTWTLSIVSGG